MKNRKYRRSALLARALLFVFAYFNLTAVRSRYTSSCHQSRSTPTTAFAPSALALSAISFIAIFVLLLFKNPLIEKVSFNYKMIQKLKNATWFQNHWRTGVFLFFINAVLFF
jgi:hypothetical protein